MTVHKSRKAAMIAQGWHQVQPGEAVLGMYPRDQFWQKEVSDGHLSVIVGREPGIGWHLSISHRTSHDPPRPGRYPKWGEIKDARYRFCPAEIAMCMILPPPDEFVNVHPTTFHLHEHTG